MNCCNTTVIMKKKRKKMFRYEIIVFLVEYGGKVKAMTVVLEFQPFDHRQYLHRIFTYSNPHLKNGGEPRD